MSKTRMKTRDAAFGFRMGAGFPGDVNRTHPASIEPALVDSGDPATAYGMAVLVDAVTQGVRKFVAGDTAVTKAYGVTVRPYPSQQMTASNYGEAAFGAATPPTTGAIDVLRQGYIMGKVPAGQAPVKGGAVHIWCAASSGVHVQGGFEAAADAGNTASITNATFNGSPDADGNVEIVFNY